MEDSIYSPVAKDEEAPPPPPPHGESLGSPPARPLPAIPTSTSPGHFSPQTELDSTDSDNDAPTPPFAKSPMTLKKTASPPDCYSSAEENEKKLQLRLSSEDNGDAEVRRRKQRELAERVASMRKRAHDADRWHSLKRKKLHLTREERLKAVSRRLFVNTPSPPTAADNPLSPVSSAGPSREAPAALALYLPRAGADDTTARGPGRAGTAGRDPTARESRPQAAGKPAGKPRAKSAQRHVLLEAERNGPQNAAAGPPRQARSRSLERLRAGYIDPFCPLPVRRRVMAWICSIPDDNEWSRDDEEDEIF